VNAEPPARRDFQRCRTYEPEFERLASGLFQDTGVRPVSRRPIFAETTRVLAVAAPVLEQLTLAVAGFVVFVTGMIAVVAHHETATLSSHCYRNKNGGFSLMRRVERGRYRPPRRLVDRG